MKKVFIKCKKCGKVQLIHPNIGVICNQCEIIILPYEFKPLKALSIKQPWSWLIINGYKDIENRNTLKNFRGTFLIHSGKKTDFNAYYDLTQRRLKHSVDYKIIDKAFSYEVCKEQAGGIVGHAEIYDCVTESDSPWFVGKYGLMIRNPKPLPFTPCKGKLSFFYPEID